MVYNGAEHVDGVLAALDIEWKLEQLVPGSLAPPLPFYASDFSQFVTEPHVRHWPGQKGLCYLNRRFDREIVGDKR